MTLGARSGGVIAVSLLIAVTTVLFIMTYPLNIGQYDAVKYLRMMLAYQSNLIYASGYPFLFHHLLSLFTELPPDQALFVETPDSVMPGFLFKLLIANHAIHLIIVASVSWNSCPYVRSKRGANYSASLGLQSVLLRSRFNLAAGVSSG